MYFQTILSIALASLVASAPTNAAPSAPASSDIYYGIGLEFQTSPLGDTPVLEPAPIPINVLTTVNVTASKISFDNSTASNVNIDSVECRAYKDPAGVQPGSAPFTNTQPALLSTNLVYVSTVLCYITETT